MARAFAALDGAYAVALFGSWAARYLGEPGRAPNDVDVLVIGEPDRNALDDAAERAEEEIGLPVQATVRTLDQWRRARESFIREVKNRGAIVPALVAEGEPELADELHALSGSDRTSP